MYGSVRPNLHPLIIITPSVRGGIHLRSIEELKSLHIPKSSMKKLMIFLHQTSMKYVTHVILNIYANSKNHQHTGLPPKQSHTQLPLTVYLSTWALNLPQGWVNKPPFMLVTKLLLLLFPFFFFMFKKGLNYVLKI